MSSCIDDLAKPYASLRLQLNAAKTEFICFDSRVNLTRIPRRFKSVGPSVTLSSGTSMSLQRAVREAPRQQCRQCLLLLHPVVTLLVRTPMHEAGTPYASESVLGLAVLASEG